jgi:hypothetical protein
MTPYQLIYDRFEKNITDYDLNFLIPSNKAEVLLSILQEACVEYINSPVDLENRDDTTLEFNIDLSATIQQIIANYMVMVWLKPYLNNQDLLELHFDTQEINSFSSANKIRSIIELHDKARAQAGKLATRLSYKNNIGRLR